MRLVADESIDAPIVERLSQSGHEVLFVAELDPGLHDDAVLNLANDRDALLLTADKDFGEPRLPPGQDDRRSDPSSARGSQAA